MVNLMEETTCFLLQKKNTVIKMNFQPLVPYNQAAFNAFVKSLVPDLKALKDPTVREELSTTFISSGGKSVSKVAAGFLLQWVTCDRLRTWRSEHYVNLRNDARYQVDTYLSSRTDFFRRIPDVSWENLKILHRDAVSAVGKSEELPNSIGQIYDFLFRIHEGPTQGLRERVLPLPSCDANETFLSRIGSMAKNLWDNLARGNDEQGFFSFSLKFRQKDRDFITYSMSCSYGEGPEIGEPSNLPDWIRKIRGRPHAQDAHFREETRRGVQSISNDMRRLTDWLLQDREQLTANQLAVLEEIRGHITELRGEMIDQFDLIWEAIGGRGAPFASIGQRRVRPTCVHR